MNFRIKMLSITLVFLMVGAGNLYAGAKGDYPTTPTTNNGKKWRIGYYEGGPYINYPLNLKALINAFAELGWVQKAQFPFAADDTDTRELWAWITKNVKSDYLRFIPDAYWSNNWDDAIRANTKRLVLDRLKNKKDVDLMLAMGTKAGQDLVNNEHSVTTIVMSTSDPLRSKIIKSAEDSGYDHVNARVDPTRYERQMRIFHEIIGFTKLGIVYEMNTLDGRTYAAIDDVEKLSKELNYKVFACNAPFSNISKKEAKRAVLKCITKLAPKIDAFYFTNHRGVTLASMPRLLAPLNKHKVPTFSQVGTREVKHGVLLSIARAGFKYIALFHAETIAKVFNGAKVRNLEQVFKDPPRIAINLKAAQIIGFDPAVDILGAADEVYDEILQK